LLTSNITVNTPPVLVFAPIMLKTNNAGTPGAGWTIDAQQGATNGRLLPARALAPAQAIGLGLTIATFSSADESLVVATFRGPAIAVDGTTRIVDGQGKALTLTSSGYLPVAIEGNSITAQGQNA